MGDGRLLPAEGRMSRRFTIMAGAYARTYDTLTRLGAELRTAREARKLSQDGAAMLAGTWQAVVSRIETGRRIRAVPLETFAMLADACGFSLALVPRDEAVTTYHAEKAAADERNRAKQLDLLAEAKAEFERASRRRSA